MRQFNGRVTATNLKTGDKEAGPWRDVRSKLGWYRTPGLWRIALK